MAFIKTPLLDAAKQKSDAAKKAQEWTRITGKPVPTTASSAKISTPVLNSAKAKSTSAGIGFGFSPAKKETAFEKIGRYMSGSTDTTLAMAPINTNSETPKAAQYVAGKAVSGAISSAKGLVNEVGYLGQGAAQGMYASAAAQNKVNDALKGSPSAVTSNLNATAKELANKPLTNSVNWGQGFDKNLNQFGVENKFNTDKGLQTIGNVAQGVGGMVPSIVSNFIVPGSSLFVMATGAAGNATEEAVKGGADTGSALLYGAAVGATEAATEKIFDGLGGIFGKGAADDIVKSIAQKFSKDATTQKAISALASTLGEGFEEWLTEYAEAYENKLLINQDSRNFKELSKDALYSGAIGSLTSLVMQGGNIANLSAKDAGETAANNTLNNVQLTAQNPSNSVINATQSTLQQAVQAPVSNVANIPTTDTAKAVEANVMQPVKPEAQPSTNPQGVGAASPQFAYQEAVNQQNSTQTAFSPEEQKIEGLRTEDITHQIITDKNALAKSQERIDFDYEGEKADLPSKQDWDKVDTTTAQLILRKMTAEAKKSGDYSEVIKWNKTLTQHNSAQGQALQANAQFANTPENIVADAAETLFGENTRKMSEEDKKSILQSVTDSASALSNIKQGDTASVISLIKKLNTVRKTTGMFTDETSKQMSGFLDYAVENFDDADAFLRDVAATQIRNIAADYQKTSVLNAIKSYRIQGMLSKVVTLLRNFASNTIVDPIDSIAGNMAVPVDMLLSKYTGTRAMPVDKSWLSEAKRKGSLDGFVKSAIQVGLDANVSKDTSKYETNTSRTFKMTGNPIERFLSTWSKWENYALQSTDEFAKGGISAESKRGIDALKAKGLVARDALTDRPTEIAKQRTLQNDGLTAKAMLKGREALNVFGLKDKQGGSFGLGDFGIPFAKIPANATAMVGNYLPATGLSKAAFNLAKTLKQAHDGTLTADQQAKAVTDLGRAISGTAGVAMFTGLSILGLIRVAGSDDKDKEALETSEGQRGTQFNLSATMRYLSGGDAKWQDGDTVASLGYIEQINGQMVMGSMLADAYKEDGSISFGDVVNANATAIFQSVLELPAMSQLTEFVNGYKYSDSDKIGGKLADAAIGYGASQVSSFVVPNIIGGVATGLDDTVRNTYSSENPLIQAKDTILSNIPFARNTLPAKLDSYGNERKYTGNKALDILNANILPGAIGKYKTSEVNQELYRLDSAVENAKYPSRNAPSKISDYDLTADEKAQYQKTSGKLTYDLMQTMIDGDAYAKMTDEQKADALSNVMGYAEYKAKKQFLSDKDVAYESDTYKKVYEAEQAGISPADYYVFKTKLSEIDTDGSPTQIEKTQAIESTDLEQKYKGELWAIQNSTSNPEKNPYTGALAQKGLSPEKSIEIMEGYSQIEKAMENYVQPEGGASSAQVQAAYFLQWLSRKGYTSEQINAITKIFKVWQMIPIDEPSRKATAFVSANPMP
ncbi:MAG: hypothetical protein VB064_07690 [Oscillospiraceae bacterium]|nr:hypothetical protein [Oscillospiraceae bacterium]